MPLSAAPMATPTMADSAMGVSITRSSPNSSSRPWVARKTPPRTPTSSPSTITDGSARISSARASRTACTTLITAIHAPPSTGNRLRLRVDVGRQILHRRIGRRLRVGDGIVHRRLHPGRDGLLGPLVQHPFLEEEAL